MSACRTDAGRLGGRVASALCCVGFSVHRLFGPLRVPERTIWSSCIMDTSVAVNFAVQPASHSWPMDIREVLPRSGTSFTRRAVTGSCGMASKPSCVACMIVPLGQAMGNGCVSRVTLVYLPFTVPKWDVVPESNIGGTAARARADGEPLSTEETCLSPDGASSAVPWDPEVGFTVPCASQAWEFGLSE